MRRSATSTVINIAEGSGKKSKKDFARYIRITIGSLLESVANIKIAIRRKYLKEEDLITLEPLIQEFYFKLIGLEKSLKRVEESNN